MHWLWLYCKCWWYINSFHINIKEVHRPQCSLGKHFLQTSFLISNGELSDPLCNSINRSLTLVRLGTLWPMEIIDNIFGPRIFCGIPFPTEIWWYQSKTPHHAPWLDLYFFLTVGLLGLNSQQKSEIFNISLSKRLMGYITHLRNQFQSMNTFVQSYDYPITLREKKIIVYFLRIKWSFVYK